MLPKNAAKVGPRYPQVVVLVGATGDLLRRKLLPGLFHLVSAGFIPECRIIGVSLDDINARAFRAIAREALEQFSTRRIDEAAWKVFADNLDHVPMKDGAGALKSALEGAEKWPGGESGRLP